MASFSLKKPWVKLVVNSKFIFYNPEDDLVTYHPPFPISQLDSFLKFYNFQINVKKFKSLLNPKNKDEINLEEDDDGTYDEGVASPKATINKTEPLIPWKIDTFPITNENKLREIKKLSETESLQKVLYFIFKNKYGVLPNYQYSNKEKMSEQVCVIKVKETSVFVGKAKSNRSLAKMSADKQALKVLVPALYDELKQSLITGVNSGFSSSLSPKNQQQKKFLRIKRQPKRKITSKTQSTMSTNVSMNANINITNGDSLNSSTSQSSQEPLSHNDLIKLEIDDPLIVDQFMGCFKYSPMNVYYIRFIFYYS